LTFISSPWPLFPCSIPKAHI